MNLSSQEVLEKFEHAVSVEKHSIAEVVNWLKEVDRRRLYIDRGFTSLYKRGWDKTPLKYRSACDKNGRPTSSSQLRLKSQRQTVDNEIDEY